VRSLPAAIVLYRDQLGLPVVSTGSPTALATSEARTQLGSVTVRLLAPDRDESIAREIEDNGEGPYWVGVSVSDLAATRRLLVERNVVFEDAPGPTIIVDPADSVGVRIRFDPPASTEVP